MMNRRVVILTLLVAMLVLFSGWLLQTEKRLRPKEAPQAAHLPDYYLNDFETSEMGPDGRLSHRIQAARLTHYPDTGTAEVEQPRLTLYLEQGEPWFLESEHGTVHEEMEMIEFRGGVRIARGSGGTITLTTDWLDLHPREQFITTDAKIVLTAPNSQVSAQGLRAYLEEERFILNSTIRGRYEPQPR